MDSDSSSDEGKMLIDVGRLEEGESSPSPVISASCSMETEAAEEEATKESEDADGAMATETANTNIEKEEEEGGSEEDDDDEDEDEEEDGEEDDGEEDDGEEEDDDDGEEDEEGDDDEDEEDEEEGEESPDGGTLLVEEDEDDDSPKCAICHGAFTTQDLGSPESCDHTFCLECILAWSRRVNTCPMDRSVFHLIFARHAGENAIYKKISVENQVQEEEEEEEDELADSFCQICQHGDREDVLLLCDGCDRGWHCDCLDPPLSEVPVNEWFCPLCRAQNEDLEEDEEETFLSRRQIPRTMASERVRASIRQARLARASMLIDSMSSEEDADAEAQPSTSSAAQRKTTPKKTTRKKKRKTTRKRKSTKRKRKTTKAGKRKSTGRKKGRRRKKRRTKASKRPRLIDPLQVDPRQRIFRSLGLSRPPVGRTIPMQKMPICKPGDLGVSLSLLGDNNELHAYSDEQQMESGEVSVPAVPKRVSKYSVSALRSHRQVGRPILGDRVPTPNKEVSGRASDSAPSTSGSLSLLDSIIQGQDILHMQSHHITINRDGSLLAKSAPTQPPRKTDSKDDDKILTFCDLNTFNEKETSIEEKENVESSGDDVRLVKDSKEESVPVENVACSADEVKADEHAEESAEKLTEESVSQDNCDTDISHAKEESASAGSPERVNTDSQDSDISPPSPDAENVMENENEDERPETMGPVFSSISDADVTGDSQDAASPALNESHPSRKSDGEIESSDSNQYIDGESSQPDVEEEPSQEAAGMEEDDNQDNTGEEGQVTSEEERGERNGEGENEDPDSKSTSAKENVGDIRKVVISSRDDSANAEPWHKESLLVQVEVKGKEGEEGLEDKEVEIVEPRKSPTPMVQIIISDSDDDRDRDDRPKVPISELPRIPKRKKGDDGGGSSASHSRGVLSRLDVDSKDYRSWEKRKGRHEGDREGRERSRGESRRHRDRSREERHTERSRDEGRHRHRRSERHSSRGHSYERHDEPAERERDRDRDRERHRSRSRDRSRRKRHERHERSRSREYERGEVERESRHKRKKRDRDRSREREAYRSRRSRSRSRSPRRRERSAADKVSHELDYYEKQNSNGSGRSEESHGHSSKRHSSDPMPFQDSKRSKLYSSRRVEHSPDKDTTGTPLADDNFSEGLSDDDQEEQEVLSDSNNKSSVRCASPPPPDRSERPPRAEAAPTAGGEPSEYDPAHPTEEDLERAGDQEDRRSHFPRNIPPPDAVLLQGGEQVPGMMGAAGDGGMISTQNIPLPGMAFNVLPPGMPPTMRPPVLVNPVLMNRPPPFRQLPPHMHGPPSRFSWAPGMPVPVRNQFPGQPMPHTQPGMGGMPPQPGMINGLMDPMGQDGGMGGPSHGQLQMQPVSSKGGFLPHPPAPPRMMGPGDGMKPSPQLEEISKLLNIPAFARRSGGKDDGLFKVPLPPQMAWKTEGAASRQGGREGGDPMESTEVVDMDMSPLDDECELELPVQAGAGMAATSADNLSKKLVNDLGKAIEKLSARQDDTPSSAVDLSNHQKFLEKVHMQERVVDEVKMAIKPFYASKSINKQEYKDIMRKAVPKICRCKSGRINPLKVKKLVEAYVEKCRRTHSQHSGHKEKKSGTPHKDAVKANGERQKVKSSR